MRSAVSASTACSFQSTLPVWGATTGRRRKVTYKWISIHAPRVGSDPLILRQQPVVKIFQSTLPVWGATMAKLPKVKNKQISIHAPRVGSDLPRLSEDWVREDDFNPRSPCGERPSNPLLDIDISEFQSTLPVWGATGDQCIAGALIQNFNPRSPCGERHLEGADFQGVGQFQSTLPVWGATLSEGRCCAVTYISIHAPRVGSDDCQV